MKYFESVKNKIGYYQIPAEGCSSEDISQLEGFLNFALPEAYKEFLMLFGQHAAGLFSGSYIEYIHLKDMQFEANALLQENQCKLLEKEDFVFLTHYGSSFYAFKIGLDDPDVFLFIEGDYEFKMWQNSGPFTKFIINRFDHMINSYRI